MIPTGPSAGPRGALLLLALSVCPGLARSAAAAPPIPDPLRNIVALAPRELVTSSLRAPSGIAVTPSGRILFTDEKDGGLFEVAADAAARLLKGGLTKPRSVVWEEGERVLFLADGLKSNHQLHGLLLRFDLASGALTVLADGLKRPRALVRSDTAGVYLSSDGLRRPDGDDGEDDTEGDDCPPDDDSGPLPGTIFRWASATGLVSLAHGFSRPDALVVRPDGMLLVAATAYRGTGPRLRGSIFQVDPAGAVSVLVSELWSRPSGLARDGTGALFLSAQRAGDCERRLRGVIRKLPEKGAANDFASGLDQPGPVTFDAAGNLLAVDVKAGLIVRFRAPARPAVDPTAPATNHDPVALTGTAEPASQVLVLGGRETAAAAVTSDGTFEVQVPLVHDQRSDLQVFAVGSGGQGLASPPVTVGVFHDGIAPTIQASVDRSPNPAGWYDAGVTVVFVCFDAGSGIASCPGARWVDTEGAEQVITGTARDQAGNTATASVTLSVDKTSPSLIASLFPAANASGWNSGDVTVSFACSDALSGVVACPPPVTVTTEGGDQKVSGAATDRAGNGATATATLNIDKTPPTIVGSISPPPGADGWNDTNVTILFECSDTTSGVASCPPPIEVTTEVARRSFTGMAVDKAGQRASATVTVNIDKTPLTPHPLALDPPSLDFGDVAVGAAATLEMTVGNVGGAPVSLDSIALGAGTSADFTLVSPPATSATLAPGASLTVRVRYAPSGAGAGGGALRIPSAGGEAVVPLAGVGVGNALSVSPISLDFGAVATGQEALLPAVIRNRGTADLIVRSIALDATTGADFSVTAPATPFAVAPGQQRSIAVRYRPVEAGARSGSISVLTSVGTAALGLSGHGQGTALQVDATALDFGNVLLGGSTTLTLRAKNTGTSPLQVGAIALELGSPPAFTLSPLPPTPFILAPGVEQAVTVTYAPSAVGSDAGRVEIRTDAGEALVPLSGRGVASRIEIAPSALALGNVMVGEVTTRPLSIVNVGTAAVQVDSIALRSGASPDITLATVPALPLVLAPGASAPVAVRYGPQEVGTDSAILDIAGADIPPLDAALTGNGVSSALRLEPVALAFSNVRAGRTRDRSFTLVNSGDVSLTVDAPRVSPASSEFSLMTPGGFTLAPGTWQAVTVRYAPARAGTGAAWLVLDTSAGPAQVALRGNAVAPEIEVSPPAVAFGDVRVSRSAMRQVTVRNVGSDTLNVTAAGLTGSAAFTLAPTPATALAPGAALVLSVSYAPLQAGPDEATLRIASDDDDEPMTTVALTGNGVAPVLSVSPASLDFGDVLVGHPGVRSITLENTGTADLSVTGASLRAGSSAAFTVGAPGAAAIAPGTSTTVAVSYDPAQMGNDTGAVDVSSDGGSAAVTLSGHAIQFVSLAVRPPSATLAAGDCFPFKAMAGLTSGTSAEVTASTIWSTLDTTVAAVAADGLVTAKVPGETTVSASFAGLGATASIHVVAPGTLRIAMPCGEVAAGGTFDAEVTVNVGPRPLGAYTFRLGYDPAVLKITAIAGGAGPGFGADPGADPASFTTGSTVFAAYQGASLATPVGAVSVARVHFELVGAPGSISEVSLQASTLADTDLADIAWTNVPARVAVKP